MIKQIN